MKKIIKLLVLLIFFGSSNIGAQIDTASYEEFYVHEAKDESILISYIEKTIETSAEGDDPREVILEGGEFVFLSTVTQRVEFISHKDELPLYEDILQFGNGEIVNYQGKSYILTTKHLVDDPEREGIISSDRSEIILIELDSIYECAPELIDKGITRGKASFGCIYPFGTDHWKYIVISDTIFTPGVYDFFFTDSVLEVRINEFCDTLDLDLSVDSIRELDFFGTELLVQSNNLLYIKGAIRRAVNSRKEPFMEYFCENTVVMRVDSALYTKLPGSSGSVLFAEGGVSIIGVLWGGMTSAGEDRHYVRFDLISQIIEVLEIYLKEKEEKK